MLCQINLKHCVYSRGRSGRWHRVLQTLCFRYAIFILFLFLVGILSSCAEEDTSDKQQDKSTNLPVISVDFVGQPKIKSSNRVRLEVKNIPRECILVVTLMADVNIQSSKPTPPQQCRELLGLPMVREVKPSSGTWEISYPAFIFDKESYLSPGDDRDIMGWIVEAYLVDEVLATPIKIPRNIGDLHVITTGEIPKGWNLLCSEVDSKEFVGNAEFNLIAIPDSNAGAFFYVKDTGLIAEIRKGFNKDFLER